MHTRPYGGSDLAGGRPTIGADVVSGGPDIRLLLADVDGTLVTQEKVLTEAVTLEFYGYPADFLAKYRAGIEAVTIADLERVAKKYIDPAKLAVLVVGNESQFGTPLTDLKLGPAHPIDITIPMPPGMQQQMEGPGN